jgi:cyanate lyase
MTKSQMTEAILNAKKLKALTWTEIAAALGKTDVWVASCAYGENTMPAEDAKAFCNLLDLGADVHAALLEYPVKGNSLEGKAIPTDPLLYRFYEILCVYGLSMKDVIHEKFGDGIMSAVDFTLSIDKESDPKGDRVIIQMNGKFLPYRRF